MNKPETSRNTEFRDVSYDLPLELALTSFLYAVSFDSYLSDMKVGITLLLRVSTFIFPSALLSEFSRLFLDDESYGPGEISTAGYIPS